MSLNSLKETYLYGNLDLIYNNRMIRNIEFDDLNGFNKFITREGLIEGWQWRFYNNIQFIINCYENYILIDFSKFKECIKFIKNTIDFYEKTITYKDNYSKYSK